jgi:peptidoglycan/LPS O-acetylase OafA/YrhL
MGLLRLLLALSVLLEHAHGIGGYAMIGGPLAVQCFFIVSGFYMGLVLNERYDRRDLNRTFWANRAIRIYGVYFFFLALYLLVFALLQLKSGTSPLAPYYESPLPLSEKLALGALNVTVVGQDLPVWLTVEQGRLAWTDRFVATGGGEVFHFMLIPAAWTLSLELLFYALAPFIARRPAWQIAAVLGISLLLRAIAAGFGFSADPFAYRFFPFELALFLAGVLAYKGWATNRAAWERPAARGLALAVPLAILAWPWWAAGWSLEAFFTPPRLILLALVAVGLPAVHGLSHRSSLDRGIGELSYPFYLGHLLVLGLVASVPALQGRDMAIALVAVLVTLLLSWLVVRVVDEPIEAFRRRLAAKAGAGA